MRLAVHVHRQWPALARLLVMVSVVACAHQSHEGWTMPESESGLSKACADGATQTCRKLMREAGHVDEFHHYGRLACDHGDAEVCERLGTIYQAQALAPVEGETFWRRKELGLWAYEKGCNLGRWFSCFMAALMDEDKALESRAQELARSTCNRGDGPVACILLAQFELEEDRKKEAGAALLRGCQLVLALSLEKDRDKMSWHDKTCWLLRQTQTVSEEAMMQPNEQAQRLAAASGYRMILISEVDALLRRGTRKLRPPLGIRHKLRPGQRIWSTFHLCFDKRGELEGLWPLFSTENHLYDRFLIEEMQQWRFIPYETNGVPTTACSTIFFEYSRPG